MSRGERALSVLVKVVGGLVALVVLGYLVVNGAAVLQAHQKRDAIADRMSAELETSLPVAADRQQELVAAAGREPDERWIEQHCDFSSDDAGWIVQNYRETCSIRTLTAWQVASDREGAALLPVEGEGISTIDGCDSLGTVGDADAYVVDRQAAEGEPWCTGATLGASRDLVGERVTLAADRWLLVVDEQPLVDEAIGCVRWSVIFCSNPFGDRHAFGEAPTT